MKKIPMRNPIWLHQNKSAEPDLLVGTITVRDGYRVEGIGVSVWVEATGSGRRCRCRRRRTVRVGNPRDRIRRLCRVRHGVERAELTPFPGCNEGVVERGRERGLVNDAATWTHPPKPPSAGP